MASLSLSLCSRFSSYTRRREKPASKIKNTPLHPRNNQKSQTAATRVALMNPRRLFCVCRWESPASNWKHVSNWKGGERARSWTSLVINQFPAFGCSVRMPNAPWSRRRLRLLITIQLLSNPSASGGLEYLAMRAKGVVYGQCKSLLIGTRPILNPWITPLDGYHRQTDVTLRICERNVAKS